jgi:hypothetical protein
MQKWSNSSFIYVITYLFPQKSVEYRSFKNLKRTRIRNDFEGKDLDPKQSIPDLQKKNGGFVGFFFSLCTVSTLHHLLSLRFHCVGSNLGLLRLRHWQSDALTTKLDLIYLG